MHTLILVIIHQIRSVEWAFRAVELLIVYDKFHTFFQKFAEENLHEKLGFCFVFAHTYRKNMFAKSGWGILNQRFVSNL